MSRSEKYEDRIIREMIDQEARGEDFKRTAYITQHLMPVENYA